MSTKQTQALTRRHFLQVLGLGAASTSLSLPLSAQAQSATSTETLEQNKALERAFVERINAQDLEGAFALIADNFVNHTAAPNQADREAAKAYFEMRFAAFPDMKASLLDMVAEGDKVVRFMKIEGTHTGEFMGTPATGKMATFLGIDIDRIVDGKIVEHWDVYDILSMMQQLGMIPSQ